MIKQALIQLTLAADLGILHMMIVFFWHAKCTSYGVLEVFTEISKKNQEASQYMAGLKSLQEAPDRVMHKTVRIELKLQWRLHRLETPGTWTTY